MGYVKPSVLGLWDGCAENTSTGQGSQLKYLNNLNWLFSLEEQQFQLIALSSKMSLKTPCIMHLTLTVPPRPHFLYHKLKLPSIQILFYILIIRVLDGIDVEHCRQNYILFWQCKDKFF